MQTFIKNYFAKKYFIINPRTISYGGLAESLMFGYKIAKYFNKKIILAVPLINYHGKHRKKKIYGIGLIWKLFLKELDFKSKIFSVIITIFLNFNLLLKKIKILGILHFLTIKDSYIENIFPLKLGYSFVEKFENKISQNEWKKIFEQKNYEYFKNNNNNHNISFYVKDKNYSKISEISEDSIADIENYRNSLNFLIKKNYKIIRTGDQLSKKFDFTHKNYKDLTIEKKNFILQQYMTLSNCKYYFGCGSAQSFYASFFNKRRVLSNLSIDYILTYPCDFFFKTDFLIFKKVYFKPLKKIISFEKLFSLDYEILNNSNNFMYIENSQNEILRTIIEFEENLDNFEPSQRQNSFNKEVKLFFKKNFEKKTVYHIFFESTFILPNFFLEKYQYENPLLDEENDNINFNKL